MIRTFCCLIALLSCLHASPVAASALDEASSLEMIVKTIGKTHNATTRAALMRGLLSGLAGRRNVPAPDSWSTVAEKLAKVESREVRQLASELSQLFGDQAAIQQAILRVQDTALPVAVRRKALQALLLQKNESVSGLLEGLLAEPELRLDAIRGYAEIENPEAPQILLGNYEAWPAEYRRSVVETLATRKSYAEALLKAVQLQQVAQADVPAHVLRSLSLILGDATQEIFGEIQPLSVDRTQLLTRYKKLLSPDRLAEANPAHGRQVFEKVCASCHQLYGSGGTIGPDLTGSNRANLDYILLNSVDPSYDVPDGYKVVVIQTVDGRVVSGVLAEENAQSVVLKTVEQPRVVVLKSDIDDRRISPKSMMPDGQLEQMKEQEVVDLIKYLQSTEQVESSK